MVRGNRTIFEGFPPADKRLCINSGTIDRGIYLPSGSASNLPAMRSRSQTCCERVVDEWHMSNANPESATNLKGPVCSTPRPCALSLFHFRA